MIDLKNKYGACATLLNPSSAEPLVWPSPLKFISELNPDAKHLPEKALMEANREREKDILMGITGQAALDGNHRWVLSDSSIGKYSLTGHFKIQEDNSLFPCGFSSGVKTLAVIPLQSCVVLQFGSVQLVGNNLIVWLIPMQYRHHKQLFQLQGAERKVARERLSLELSRQLLTYSLSFSLFGC